MAVKIFKPTTPTRRHTVLLASHLERTRPHKQLTGNVKYDAGRSSGRLTVRHKGGRVKRAYRIIDFKRDKYDTVALVETIEYDPNRSSDIALLIYSDGERRYILAPFGLKKGDSVVSGETVAVKVGNSLPLKKIPAATTVHNVEITRGHGGILGRAAGTGILIQGGTKGYIQLKMPSGEIRLVREECYATVGTLSNPDHKNEKSGKAGRNRWRGIRPTVRGVAMSGGKHPHGDGQGKSGRHGPGGPAKDKWGNRVGLKTRKNKRTHKFIVQRKTNKRGRKNKKYKTVV
jgi:large subunit ribosomal protein L2